MPNIATLYELLTADPLLDRTLTADIDASVSNPANVSAWAAGTYTLGQYVKHNFDGTERTYYCVVASTTAEPGANADWEAMWVTATGPSIPNASAFDLNPVFDGQGHTISNWWRTQSGYSNSGVFGSGHGSYSSTIRNVRVVDALITHTLGGGGLGFGNTLAAPVVVEDCYFHGTLASNGESGGAIAANIYGTARRVFCDVAITSTSSFYTSGFCFNVRNGGSLQDCAVRGTLAYSVSRTSTNIAGGMSTVEAGATVDNCYAAMSITNAPNARGFASVNNGTVTDCFWDSTIGPATSAAGTAKTTAEMKTLATFTGAGWDAVAGINVVNVWGLDGAVNDGYPFLQVVNSFAAAPAPAISGVTPSTITAGSNPVIAGTNFEASQGTGTVKLSPTDNVSDAAVEVQGITTWNAGDPGITLSGVTFPAGTTHGQTLYLFVTNNSGDTNAGGYPVTAYIAPTLTSPTAVSIGTTTVTPRVTTDTGNGTCYYVITPQAESEPSNTQVEAGTNAADGAPVASGSQVVSTAGVITFSEVTGLTAGTAYRISYAHSGTPS